MHIKDTIDAVYEALAEAAMLVSICEGTLTKEPIQVMAKERAATVKAKIALARAGLNG